LPRHPYSYRGRRWRRGLAGTGARPRQRPWAWHHPGDRGRMGHRHQFRRPGRLGSFRLA